MANLRDITQLPVAGSADGLNLIVNDNGEAKQIAASAVGAQADWAEMDETSPAFIKNKPVEEWDLDVVVNTTINSEDDSFVFEPSINVGTFNAIKNKLLNNETVRTKLFMLRTSPEDASRIGYENSTISSVSYVPQNMFGSNPEMIMSLFHSLYMDVVLMCCLYPDNTVEIMEY